MNLIELTSNEIENLDKDNVFVLLPLGSIEQHGPHLPLGTKCYLSETIAFEAAKKLKNEKIQYLITPVVPFMPCNSSLGFAGNFYMSSRTFSDMLYEIGKSFYNQGFKYLFFVNLSISPEAIKAVLTTCEDLSSIEGFKCADPLPVWNFTKNDKISNVLKKYGLNPKDEVHGDSKDTSALMYIAEDLMHADIAKRLPSCCVNRTWEILKGNYSFKEMGSEQGYLGTPSKATPEIGKEYIEAAATGLFNSMMFIKQGGSMPELPLQIRMLLKMIDLDEM